MIAFSPSLVAGAPVILFLLAAIAYRAILPRPIPGIPYKKTSAKRLLGDAPEV
jgi:hypothetical protein